MVIIKFPKNPIDCHISAVELMKKGEYDKAIAYYRLALSMDPKFVKAYVNIGVLLKAKGKLNDAIYNFEKAIKIEPKEASAYSNLGNIYWMQRELAKAKKYYMGS